jgi:hypothetical protein
MPRRFLSDPFLFTIHHPTIALDTTAESCGRVVNNPASYSVVSRLNIGPDTGYPD